MIQSAWLNQTAKTLHPAVLYHKHDNEELKDESIVIVSDEMGLISSVIVKFLDAIVPRIKKCVPKIHKVHYDTEGPTSQYRNKVIIMLLRKTRSYMKLVLLGITLKLVMAKGIVMG